MSLNEGDVRLRHLLDRAKEAVAMCRGRTRAELDSDRQLNLSLVRLLEIVGEAAGRMPAEEKARVLVSAIWPAMAASRTA